MMRDRIFQAWAPDDSAWSAWVKPVLFAHLDDESESAPAVAEVGVGWAGPANGNAVVVVDLPGASGVGLGLELAAIGYRPVPLYNACPSPDGPMWSTEPPPITAVDVVPIMKALAGGATRLSSCALDASAPPAFLLDAARRGVAGSALEPGSFDNRSISLPTDFPSGTLLRSRGVRRVLVVQEGTREPQADLAHTLARWQKAGIEISAIDLRDASSSAPLRVTEPPLFRRMWYAFLATAGLRRSPFGGFGGTLPVPSAG
jgi:hypothetical protein